MRIALIGDVHLAWGADDVAWFDARPDYGAVLFTGDLPGLRHRRAFDVAARMAPLETPAYMIAGNHDGPSLFELLLDLLNLSHRYAPLARSVAKRVGRLDEALGNVTLAGYSHHTLERGLGLIVARPHTQGGGLNFAPYIAEAYGPRNLAESSKKLCDVVDACPHERLVFLGHNGPSGLGDQQNAMWGADHRRRGGDWGDVDYRAAIDHALATGRRVLAVVAGHMHQRTKQKKIRPWCTRRDGVLYINAARVPRVFHQGPDGARKRYHIALSIDGTTATAEQVTV